MSYDELLLKLRGEYIKSLQNKIPKLETLLADGDSRQLHSELHKLKGTGKTYGLPQVTDICSYGEALCPDEDKASLPTELGLIPRLLDKVVTCYLSGESLDLTSDADYQKLQNRIPRAG